MARKMHAHIQKKAASGLGQNMAAATGAWDSEGGKKKPSYTPDNFNQNAGPTRTQRRGRGKTGKQRWDAVSRGRGSNFRDLASFVLALSKKTERKRIKRKGEEKSNPNAQKENLKKRGRKNS